MVRSCYSVKIKIKPARIDSLVPREYTARKGSLNRLSKRPITIKSFGEKVVT